MAKFEIVMIGNSAVGKSSMLSVLSKELTKFNGAGRLQLKPTSDEFDKLDDKFNDLLKELENSEEYLPVKPRYVGDADYIEHPFEFKINGKKKCDVVFVDTPGNYTRKRTDDLKERVNNAFGVFCVVDAAVLMGCKASKNNELNRPAAIEEILNAVFTDGDDKQPRFVTFVLTKCEKWMHGRKDRTRLSKKFHSCFDQTISMMRGAVNSPSVDLVAIQTMGGVEFAELDENDEPVFVVVDKNMTPKDCAYPLVILLRKVVLELAKKESIWARILRMLGIGEDIRQYLQVLEGKVEKPVLWEEL